VKRGEPDSLFVSQTNIAYNKQIREGFAEGGPWLIVVSA
jgi:hypothetical protein